MASRRRIIEAMALEVNETALFLQLDRCRLVEAL